MYNLTVSMCAEKQEEYCLFHPTMGLSLMLESEQGKVLSVPQSLGMQIEAASLIPNQNPPLIQTRWGNSGVSNECFSTGGNAVRRARF